MQFSSQRGGALLVAMVMIFMLSIMGVSVMRSSTLEKRMAINAIQTAATFQAAESAANLALNRPANLTTAHTAGYLQNVVLPIDEVHDDIGLASTSTIKWVGTTTMVPGYSIGDFEGLYYIAQGVSAIESVRSQSTVEQGAYRVVPAQPTE
jgi:type II secretory pathway pseudopilin PulG